MCTRDKEFTIRGTEDCLARGFDRTGFFEVDTGEQRAWTVQLTETGESAPQRPLNARHAGAADAGPPPACQSQLPTIMPDADETPAPDQGRGDARPRLLQRTMIARLFEAGADVFRINMSHTSHDRMRELVAAIRAVEASTTGRSASWSTCRVRSCGSAAFADGAGHARQRRDLHARYRGRARRRRRACTCRIRRSSRASQPGHTLLLDDGKVRLIATEASRQKIVTRVEVGGKLSDRKGVSLPDTVIPFSALTPKDRSDLEAALDAGVDWIALSFIQRPDDIAEAKKITRGRAAVMAKIEKPQAVHRLDEIIDVTDAMMVARGDLGVEMPLEKVPGIQKQLTRAARSAGKPVVVATQMLE